MKKYSFFVVAIVFILLVSACSTSNGKKPASQVDSGAQPNSSASADGRTGKEAPPTKKEGQIRIGFAPTAMDTYYERVLAGVNEEIDKLGGESVIKLDVQAPSSQSATDDQIRSIEGWISQDVDAIAVALYNESALLPLFRKAAEKGIPIFTFNSPVVTNEYYVSDIGYDQSEGGRAQAQWIADHYKDQKEVKIAMLEGLPGPHTSQRMKGFNEVIKNYPNLKVVSSQSAGWVRAQGISVTENILTSHPDIDVLAALYDEMALGGLEALKARGLDGKVAIVGYENMKEANTAIKNGQFAATVDTGAKQQGRNIIQTIKKYVVDGEMVPKQTFDKVKVYDKDNIQEFDQNDYIYVPQQK